MKAADLRLYRINDDVLKVEQPLYAIITNLNFPIVPYFRTDFRRSFCFFDIGYFTENLAVKYTGYYGEVTNLLVMRGVETNLGAGFKFFSAKSTTGLSAQLGFRYSPGGLKPAGILTIGLPSEIVQRIKSLRHFRSFWSITWEGNAYMGLFPVLQIGGDLTAPGTPEYNFYHSGFFATLGINAKGFRLGGLKKKNHY